LFATVPDFLFTYYSQYWLVLKRIISSYNACCSAETESKQLTGGGVPRSVKHQADRYPQDRSNK
ncbi:hypothetical protein, partial [Salmonella enterica]|uniref:hypothetical protein n=1 Tax=Salmonella enterica TaxID=28901 RepID=UPI001C3D0ABE